MGRAAATFVLILVAAMLAPMGQGHARYKTNQVRGEYVPPKNPEHEPIYHLLKEAKGLERLSQFLSPFRLPRRLTLKVEGCDGSVNAYYEDDAVMVCYEYLDFILKSAPKDLPAATAADIGITTRVAVIAPTVDVFLHEVGHAVFDMLKIPVLGREEDAADSFSAFIMLQSDAEVARKLILGVAFLGAKEAIDAQKENPTLKAFADEHGLPAQRYFNVLCMAYGADPKTFANAITVGRLPADRAEGCEAEYQQFHYAFERLIRPHISRRLAKKMWRKRWLDLDGKDGKALPIGAATRP